MELTQKLAILAQGARYDVSCSSSGSRRARTEGGFGNASKSGICHSWTEDGRCVSLLKILFTNKCIYDCFYCANGASNNIHRATFTPEEVCQLTEEFYRRNYIEGLFLSSAILNNEDYTMELLATTVKMLREDYRFNGYIHLKGIPGADKTLLIEAGKHVDRLSINIELPTQKSLQLLAPEKNGKEIVSSMKAVSHKIKETKLNRPARTEKTSKSRPKKTSSKQSFVPAGQSTQLIVGATNDSDRDILRLSENLYQQIGLKRVFYSAFIPISNKHKEKLPAIAEPPYLREHRLYQADWLLRFYKFNYQELFDNQDTNLSLELDPKAQFALRNFHLFPQEINQASKKMLLRIPGIGPKSARRILKARKHFQLGFEDLKRMGIVLKRAKYFITCKGKYYGGIPFKPDLIYSRLLKGPEYKQLSLWGGN
ncbi:putative DNA modification/repair radical SAM protein [Natranaerobius thermophilus]|uniref:Helix-hairpin-helix motif n=1 Tax=Natranaerobius thermophilus (strain ATCC BAA-1301 / DSM 18059 / JW/NM-WN-LF) TaxID=457570 RepID=B2A8E1_NATTJ|nr:putative DNA modification/repair radical SAM protein [Natranaerobius thermophilus]ACB84510.1 helix-hairpin-helix motif [Natranaerobius thermophilus JW/NM-WN-LF]